MTFVKMVDAAGLEPIFQLAKLMCYQLHQRPITVFNQIFLQILTNIIFFSITRLIQCRESSYMSTLRIVSRHNVAIAILIHKYQQSRHRAILAL